MPCFRGSQFKEKKFFRIHPHHPHQNLPKCPNIKGWRPVEGALTLTTPSTTLTKLSFINSLASPRHLVRSVQKSPNDH